MDNEVRFPAPPDYIEVPWLFLSDWPFDKIAAATTTLTLVVGTKDNQVGKLHG